MGHANQHVRPSPDATFKNGVVPAPEPQQPSRPGMPEPAYARYGESVSKSFIVK
jgi:hypothetical protein